MMKTEKSKHKLQRPHWSCGIDGMSSRLKKMQRILIASDFDGTLSPIVERPSEAFLPIAVEHVLKELASHHPRISLAFVSGREISDLTSRVAISEESIFAGNHGLEISGDGRTWIHPMVVESRRHLENLLTDLDERFGGVPGIELEDKGLSVTLHYRRMLPERLPLLHSAIESLVLPIEIRRHEGKKVFEFRPRIEWNKGSALRQIARQLEIPLEAVVFLGDDVTDEDAFEELGPKGMTVHVGSESAPSRAAFNASDPADVARFLRALLGALPT